MGEIKEIMKPLIEDKDSYELLHAGICRIFITNLLHIKDDKELGQVVFDSATQFLDSLKIKK